MSLFWHWLVIINVGDYSTIWVWSFSADAIIHTTAGLGNYHHQLQETWHMLLPFATTGLGTESAGRHKITELIWYSFFVDRSNSTFKCYFCHMRVIVRRSIRCTGGARLCRDGTGQRRAALLRDLSLADSLAVARHAAEHRGQVRRRHAPTARRTRQEHRQHWRTVIAHCITVIHAVILPSLAVVNLETRNEQKSLVCSNDVCRVASVVCGSKLHVSLCCVIFTLSFTFLLLWHAFWHVTNKRIWWWWWWAYPA